MSSTLAINQMNQLANKLTKMGWDESRVTKLGQANAMKYRAIEEILDGKSIKEAIKAALLVRDVGTETTHLRFLQSATVAPTVGTTTLAQASDLFTGHLDSDFKKWGTDVAGTDTEQTSAEIYEMKEDGAYAQLFGSLVGASGSCEEVALACRPLCWQQGQIKEFARTHRNLLRQDGYATLFLFEVNGEVFVADVRVDGGQLKAFVLRFGYAYVWSAAYRHRLVVPQQAF
jgi:hypothetical protein